MTKVESLLDDVVAAIEGGQRRPQQVEMAEAVHAAFTGDNHLAVQGPTGVGKSLAYLVPAILAASRDERTVVVTATKALQDQLAQSDLPFLAETLNIPFTFSVLKGRSNYVCKLTMHETAVELRRTGDVALDLEIEDDNSNEPKKIPLTHSELEELDRIIAWSEETDTGDQAELTEMPSPRIWQHVSVSRGGCIGSNCTFVEDCFSQQAIEIAREVDIVIVNAALYGAHLGTEQRLLPEHQHLVIDEAHHFEDALVSSLGVEMSGANLKQTAQAYRAVIKEDGGPADVLIGLGDTINQHLEDLHDATRGERIEEIDADLVALFSMAQIPLQQMYLVLSQTAKNTEPRPSSGAATGDLLDPSDLSAMANSPDSAEHNRVQRATQAVGRLSDEIEVVLRDRTDTDVMWVTRNGSRFALRITTIEIHKVMAPVWYDDDAPTVILTSATLDPRTAGRLGLKAQYLAVDSPFPYKQNSLLYVPKLPLVRDPEWFDALCDVLEETIQMWNGRTLALFTSNRILRDAADELRSRLGQYKILAQGDAAHPQIQRQFIEDEHASLFATASFWTGVSAPGSTCSAVVIDKLPFPVPTDPLIKARTDLAGERGFFEVSIPAAAMQLAQGAGRLIRTIEDVGVVTVCDPRLAEARYRKELLDMLPPMKRTRTPSEVAEFVAKQRSKLGD